MRRFGEIQGVRFGNDRGLANALYAGIVLVPGVLLYNESLTHLQLTGVVLAIGGVILINWQ